MTADALGFDELFEHGRLPTDSWCDFLVSTRLLAAESAIVVEAGCGRGLEGVMAGGGRSSNDLRGPGRKVVGIDIDPAGATNPLIDEFRPIGDDLRWPVADGEADLVVSDWVLEHVEDPLAFVDELHRVLRPGGAFVARTVSRHSLLAAGARLVPNRLHSAVLRRFQPGREAIDVFPTAYRMNSRRDLGTVLDDRFDWTATSRSGLEQYLKRWPALRTAAKVVEPRLPGPVQMALVVYARRRPDGQ